MKDNRSPGPEREAGDAADKVFETASLVVRFKPEEFPIHVFHRNAFCPFARSHVVLLLEGLQHKNNSSCINDAERTRRGAGFFAGATRNGLYHQEAYLGRRGRKREDGVVLSFRSDQIFFRLKRIQNDVFENVVDLP